MAENAKIVVISGFSGVGKGTVVKYIMKNYSDYELSVSATTRGPRNNEVAGVDYHYITDEQFEEMIKNDQFLEYAQFADHSYGSPRAFVEENIKEGNNVILEIETKGAIQVKKNKPETLMIFLLPPDAKTLKERLINRNTETEEEIKKRIKEAGKETENLPYYEYFVINDEIEKCADNVIKIITGGQPDLPSKEQVEWIKNDILKMAKGE